MPLLLPERMTEAEVQALRAQGWDVLPGRETPTYRPEWGVWEAIRDIIQNSLDETESFSMRKDNVHVSGSPGGSGDFPAFVISDPGGGFNVPALLLGQPKPKEAHLRGRFGEGLKIAVLALLRNEIPVSFETVGLEGAATFMQQTLVGVKAETLTFVVRRNSRRKGTAWYLWGYRGPTFEERFAQMLPPPDALVPSLVMTTPIPRNDAIWDPKLSRGSRMTSGLMYARDILMGKIDSPFTYNLWSFELAPDRHAPRSENDMLRAMSQAWSGVARQDMLEDLFRALYPRYGRPGNASDARFLEQKINWSYTGNDAADRRAKTNAASWKAAARAVFGPKIVVLTDAKNAQNVQYLGGNPVDFGWLAEGWMQMFFPTDQDFIAEKGKDLLASIQIVRDMSLGQASFANLDLLRAINKLLPLREENERRPLLAATTIGEGDVLGYWDEDAFTIGIKQEALADPVQALDIYIHEYAHYFTQAPDVSERHARGISLVGAYIAELFALGQISTEKLLVFARRQGLSQ